MIGKLLRIILICCIVQRLIDFYFLDLIAFFRRCRKTVRRILLYCFRCLNRYLLFIYNLRHGIRRRIRTSIVTTTGCTAVSAVSAVIVTFCPYGNTAGSLSAVVSAVLREYYIR